jgi:uncharacterized protein with HEPN domain
MVRDISAYLYDIIDACDSIASILAGISFETFVATREKRSAVEREFILIGEATSVLAKFWPDSFKLLSDGRKAIGFRNILTDNYASVDQETAYETALQDVPKLRRECVEILRETDEAVNSGRGNSPGAD